MKILFFLGLLIGSIYCQIDDTFCNLDNIVPDDGEQVSIPSHNSSERFQISAEKNSNKNLFTVEIDEFFDGQSNIGISINTFIGQKLYTYSYYDQNELLLIQNEKCKVYKLNESYGLTPFYVVNSPDGTEHIISELGFFLSNLKIQNAYLGSKNRYVRGIPVREWQTCLYSKKESSTLKVTLSFTNEKLWVPALSIKGYESIPVQAKIEYKDKDSNYFTEYISYTQFKPGILLQEEDYFTRSGIYCEGRITKKPLPNIPNSFSLVLQAAQSSVGADSLIGTISTSRLELDYDKKLFRYDYRLNGIRYTEIHDRTTNLKYVLDRYHRNCSIQLMQDLSIEDNPFELFEFNKDPPFEYVGQRRVRGVNTDVWIAPRGGEKWNGTWEWHFMADGWIVQESTAIKRNEPLLLLFNLNVPSPNGNIKRPIYYHISNFDQTRIDIFDFDVSTCTSLKNQHLRFSLTSDKYEIMKNNRLSLREGLVNAIKETTQVSYIRISQLEPVFDNGTVYVLFTLIERSTLGTGDQIKLKDAIKSLNDSIISSKLSVSFVDLDNKNYEVKADGGSLIPLSERNGRYEYSYYDIKKGYGGGEVAGFIIGFLIVGLVVGLVAGIFFIIRRQSITLGPLSFLNPNFKNEA
ncbi:EF-hand domain-containing D1 [Brachionus plicatilis]|uniref:EF-hand domain-containing D1 n=1 Tax=Brachionus plicatilis TaxID=10195 RepID=A0A3M7SJ52_BRAPC|nr:EF-hand domain-containing D1 [Brachionus plicatilis]